MSNLQVSFYKANASTKFISYSFKTTFSFEMYLFHLLINYILFQVTYELVIILLSKLKDV